jgi:hypothetical protein
MGGDPVLPPRINFLLGTTGLTFTLGLDIRIKCVNIPPPGRSN